MLVAIIGTRLAGKSTVQEFLVREKSFAPLRLGNKRITGVDAHDALASDADSAVTANADPGWRQSFTDGMFSDDSFDESDMTASLGVSRPNHRSFLLMQSPTVPITAQTMKEQQANAKLLKQPELQFDSSREMLDFATQNWNQNFVTTDLVDKEDIETFNTRPFFLLVSVDAPVLDRFQRGMNTELDDFIREHDHLYYGEPPNAIKPSVQSQLPTSLHSLAGLVSLRIINAFHTLPDFHAHLEQLDIPNLDRLRPSWDTYFMKLASLASLRSNCMKRRVGAVLVRNNRVVSTGYNGTARGLRNCNEGGCTRCNSGVSSGQALDECVCLHAEENALLEAGRERVGESAILYCDTCPCLRCTVKIIQTGIKEVVYNLSYKVDDASLALFTEAGVQLRKHAPPPADH